MNTAKCKFCHTVLESKHRHDYQRCICGAIAIDGGNDYIRRMGEFASFDEEFDRMNAPLDAVSEPLPSREGAKILNFSFPPRLGSSLPKDNRVRFFTSKGVDVFADGMHLASCVHEDVAKTIATALHELSTKSWDRILAESKK